MKRIATIGLMAGLVLAAGACGDDDNTADTAGTPTSVAETTTTAAPSPPATTATTEATAPETTASTGDTMNVTYTVVVPTPCADLAGDAQFDAFHAGVAAYVADSAGTQLAEGTLSEGVPVTETFWPAEVVDSTPVTFVEEYCKFSTGPLVVPVLDAYTGGVAGDTAGTWGRAVSYDLDQDHLAAGEYELIAHNFN